MPRVLLVDDSALVRSSMHAALEPLGVELGHAENGAVALDKATASRWDLIFLDVVMPVMDGIKALTEIRAAGVMTPVVLVTSVSTASNIAPAVKLGSVHYIGKPFTPDTIKSIATALLRLDPRLAHTPRVLVRHVDPDLPRQLAKMLPSHVIIDASDSLAVSIDLADANRPDLVLFETANLADEAEAIGGVLRARLPAAGIFALDAGAGGECWHPEGPLDGVLRRPLDPSLGRGFLYANFLRPLVFIEGNVARAAGFQGAVAHVPAYLAMMERILCDRLDLTLELQIDLRDLRAEPAAIVGLVKRLNAQIREAGGAPTFLLGKLPHVDAELHGVIVQ